MKFFLVCMVSLCLSLQAEKPNIVFLLADDMGYADLGCFGSPVIKSPHLDKIASEGIKLTNCYSASPNCSPARTGILTGRSPYRVGMYDFARFKPMHIPKEELTMAEILKNAGYQTMFGGKWHCSGNFASQPNPGDHGFDHWYAHAKNFGKDPEGFRRNGEVLPAQKGWMAEIVVNEAMDFISKRDKSKPFMTMLWFSEPHTPVLAAPEFIEMYKNKETDEAAKKLTFGGPQVKRNVKEDGKYVYFGCVTMLDHHIGRLMKYLKENGLEENTIIVFTSDNGPEHRVKTSFGSPGHLRGAKGHIHEGGYHVPGIIKWPGKIKAGSESSEPVNGTDWLPSLTKAAGAKFKSGKTVDGADVFPALVEGMKVKREKPMLWWLYHARGGKEVSMRFGDFKILANMLPQKQITVNDAAPPEGMPIMDFIKKADLGNFSLYNLREDPSEKNNLADKYPEKLAELKKIMIELHSEIRAEGPVYDMGKGKKKKKK